MLFFHFANINNWKEVKTVPSCFLATTLQTCLRQHFSAAFTLLRFTLNLFPVTITRTKKPCSLRTICWELYQLKTKTCIFGQVWTLKMPWIRFTVPEVWLCCGFRLKGQNTQGLCAAVRQTKVTLFFCMNTVNCGTRISSPARPHGHSSCRSPKHQNRHWFIDSWFGGDEPLPSFGHFS